ncbi:hypothetical protein MKS83_10045 [Chryseobacterium sp. Y16C]|uniref:T9SS type A sorting domain-containing protein n=1 Tax=Chryseobacterium sp. Y16C TaxID=2920939 RepID=UPI001F0B9677|nr:T9SS type A sorting domain-containing protein [Chryseobacterium sp. Y16C]UMQ44026.1 hypothetical protein MKS83_10045 [Chryseobacterium sp. Y16C]
MPPSTYPIYFQYDEAGNQVFRGDGMLSRSANTTTSELIEPAIKENLQGFSSTIKESDFWNNIRIYPVPVKDNLTIDWNDSVNDLISEIGLYEQSTIHWVFQNKKVSTLNKTVKINMTKQYMGVYILTFTLKDGRRLNKNITKY